MLDNFASLKNCKNLLEIHESSYFQKHFIEKYINDLPRLAFEIFGKKLSYQQIEIINKHNWEGGRLAVPSGHGCHGINTPIMMFDGGVKNVQDIKTNDLLMGDDGITPRKVLSLARGKETMYRFVFNDKTERIYNKSHILSLVASQTHGTQKKGDKVTIKVSDWLNWSDRKKRTHCIYKSSVKFNKKELPIEPYMLGIWLGDGSAHEASITNIDKEVLDYLYSYAIKYNYSISASKDTTRTKTYRLHKNTRKVKTKILQSLHDLKLYKNKHIPLVYKTASITQRLELLAGLIDTDGSIDKTKRQFEITQKCKNLAYDIYEIARSCGMHSTIKKVKKYCYYNGVKKEGDYYRVNISRNTEKIPTKISRKKAQIFGNEQRTNLNFGIKSVKEIGVDNYYGFSLDRNQQFLDGDFIVSHNTGKTFFLGFLSTAHLLLFPKSITRIQAPKEDQVTKFSFKEIKSMISALDTPIKVNNRLIKSEWAFLANHIQQNTTLIYAKGFKESWYIEPATAPKGDPTNLSGQHNWSYLLLFDECSGIPDTHIDGSLGALSEKFNSCIAFSQHTRTSGRFHEFVTTSSEEQGGVWKIARMNSEQSPRVTASSIRAWRSTYTENEYNVRVLGLPPLFEDGYLLNTLEAQRAYSKKGKEWIDTLIFDTLTLSTDVAYTGLRDSSVYTVIRVAVVTDITGKQKVYCIVDDINVFQGKNAKLPTDLSHAVFDALLKLLDEEREEEREYLFKRLPIDATAGGHEAYTILDEKVMSAGLGDALVQGITWGSGRLVGFDKKRFLNQRAKANVMLSEAIRENRFYINTNKSKTRVLNELSHIPFTFTADFRYKILSKQEMAKKGINSPDIIDCFSQQFLVPYVQTSNEVLEEEEIELEEIDMEEGLDDDLDGLDEGLDENLDEDEFEDFESTLIM